MAQTIQCDDCLRTFNNENAFKCHRTRQSKLSAQKRCGYKRRLRESIAQRDIAQRQVADMDPIEIVEKVNALTASLYVGVLTMAYTTSWGDRRT